jgi:hypothetical protein
MAAVILVGVGLAASANAFASTRHAPRSNRNAAPPLPVRMATLRQVPDSALRLPANLKAGAYQPENENRPPSASLDRAPLPVLAGGVRRQGSLGGQLGRDYDEFCDNVTARIWSQPNGRRLTFDSRGKPGLAVEIPLR